MSQETQIGSLGGGISDEDSKLVDSILNDLNGGQQQEQQQQQQQEQQMQQQQMQQQQMQQQQMPRDQNGNELTPEKIKQIQMQRQMAMQQQQLMAQQQQMQQQQQMVQQVENVKKEGKESNLIESTTNNFVDNIKKEAKGIILVILLSIIMNLEQVDNLFKLQSGLFLCENGTLNMQAIFIKSLVIGAIYYGVNSYLL
tara:strand:- start:99 stop:692 length:594 start_codon:yes stop_codon:yes gene_type:complete